MIQMIRPVLRWGKQKLLTCKYVALDLPLIRLNYARALRRVRRKKEPIRVLFCVGELSKWKTEGVFRLMQASPDFEPIVGVLPVDRMEELSKDELRVKHQQNCEYFKKQGMEFVETFSIETGESYSLQQFCPDVVFYQQPWGVADVHLPKYVSKYALTCYTPYFVPNYGLMELDAKLSFLSMLYRYYTLSSKWVKSLRKAQPWWKRITTYVASGHPMLDCFSDCSNVTPKDGIVIYAPHWSIKHPLNSVFVCYSTFLYYGEQILKYAQQHPEIKWAFKPHPILRLILQREGIWGKEKTDAYYAAWEKIGVSCYTNEYPELFKQSRLMITDCASFLCEYASTKRPLIRLVSPDLNILPIDMMKPLFDSFYNAHSFEELLQFLDTLVVKGEDPKRDERIQCATDYGLLDSCAAKRIFEDIKIFCKR